MLCWLLILLSVVKATAIEPHYRAEPPEHASLLSEDPEYEVYEKNLVEWREVKVIGHWFWMRMRNKKILVVPTFYHTLVAVAEVENYNGESGSGSKGWDLTKSKDKGFYLRSETGLKPKSYKHTQFYAPYLKIKRACFTSVTNEQLLKHVNEYRGVYDLFNRNCVDFTYYVLKFLCGESLAKKAISRYRHPLLELGRRWGDRKDRNDQERLNYQYEFHNIEKKSH